MQNDPREQPVKVSIIVLLLIVLTGQSTPTSKPAQLPPASDMKTVGLIGGTSWYSTVEYYQYINKAVNDAYGNNTNPPLIIINLNQQRIQELQAKNQWGEIAAIFAEAVSRLRSAVHKQFYSVRTRHTKSTLRLPTLRTSLFSILRMQQELPSKRRG
jgi:aspartate racemase